ncbi:hypothetical protein MASR2M48_23500 [Spirochaetota bacterium]
MEGIPVYHTVRRAVDERPANAAMLFVPPRFTKDAVFEALDSGFKKIVTIADGIPLQDAIQIRKAALSCGARVIGGNTSGVISPGQAMMGMFPYWIERVYKPGRIGVMTRSGSLTNEVTAMVVAAGFGVSSLIGVGGDPVPGTRFAEMLPDYQSRPGDRRRGDHRRAGWYDGGGGGRGHAVRHLYKASGCLPGRKNGA